METKKITDEQLKNKSVEIIDELSGAVKKATRKFFELMVERTAEKTEGLVDKGSDNIKKKIIKGKDNAQKN